jgi:uncharacterized protein with GYD domain
VGKYLITGSYTQAGIGGVLKDGGSGRVRAVEELTRSVGGSLESFYFAFGSNDFYVTVDLPDNTAAAGVAATIGATGAVSLQTIVLLTPEEMDAAVKLHPSYRAPGD